jgi:8-oxo-dGTP diphosphatase
LRVVIAVIFNEHREVFITQRGLSRSHAGIWEFPGGKIEDNESPAMALERELKEEIGIIPTSAIFWKTLEVPQTHFHLSLSVYWITAYQGEPSCLEDQLAGQWVSIDALSHYEFPKANAEIIDGLKRLSEP